MHKRIYPNSYRLMRWILETFNFANLGAPGRVNSAWCSCYTTIFIKMEIVYKQNCQHSWTTKRRCKIAYPRRKQSIQYQHREGAARTILQWLRKDEAAIFIETKEHELISGKSNLTIIGHNLTHCTRVHFIELWQSSYIQK